MITSICRVENGDYKEFNSKNYDLLPLAKMESGPANHIIDWETKDVWVPEIKRNTFEGHWKKATPSLAFHLIEMAKEDNLDQIN